MTQATKELERAWKSFRKTRRGYLHDEASFNADWQARASEGDVELVKVLREAGQDAVTVYKSRRRECTHDAEWDYCGCCAHDWERELRVVMSKLAEALLARTQNGDGMGK